MVNKKIKLVTLIITSFILVHTSYAQNANPSPSFNHSFLSLTVGPSIPIGEYSHQSINDVKAGFAMQGMNYNLGINALLGAKTIGICALISVYDNPVDEEALKKEFDSNSSIPDLQITTTDWKATNILIGFCTSAAGDRFAFNMRLMFGVAICTSPEVKVTGTSPSLGIIYSSQGSKQETPLALGAGITLTYNLSQSFGLVAGGDVILAGPEFNDSASSSNTDSTRQPMHVINLSGGIAYMF